MHGEGFYLGLTTLNYAEVGRNSISDSQWSDMLFTMGVQCQFSCVCITSLLAVSSMQPSHLHHYFETIIIIMYNYIVHCHVH